MYDPVSIEYYTGTVWPAVAPSIVGLCLFATALLGWSIWRVVKNCTCCCRRPKKADTWGHARWYQATEEGSVVPSSMTSSHPLDRLTAKGVTASKDKSDKNNKNDKEDTINVTASTNMGSVKSAMRRSYSTAGKPTVRQARGQLVVLTGAVVMGLGVVACSIYGFTTIRAPVVTESVGVINDYGRGYAEDVLRTVQGAVDVGRELDATISDIQDQLSDGGLTAVIVDAIGSGVSVRTTVGDIQRDLRVLLADAQEAIDSAEQDVIGSIDDAVTTYEPPAQRYNGYRVAAMYVLYSLSILFAMTMVAMALMRWPFLHSLSFCLFMVLMVVAGAAMVAHAGGAYVVHDTCDNLEGYVVSEVVDGQRASDILTYYFNVGVGSPVYSDVYDVIRDGFGMDVQDVIRTVRDAQQAVEQAIAGNGLEGAVVGALLQDEVNTAQAQADDIVSRIQTAVDMLQPEAIMNGPYADVRGFFCCSTLDDIGEIWLGLTLTMSFGFALVLFAFAVTRLLDALPVQHWYSRYRPA